MPWLWCILSNVFLASLLAIAAWLAQRRLRWALVAHILWVLVLVKLVTPPLVSVRLGESPGFIACTLGTCGCEPHARAATIAGEVLLWSLLAVWTAGAVATGWNTWRRWTYFRRLLACAQPAPPEWQSLAARLVVELSLRRPPQILVTPGRLPPLVVAGWRRPSMLLPRDLLDRLDATQREALVLHELFHIKRGDHLVRMLELTVHLAYWWLPVLGPIARLLRACEETCCDAAVVAHLPHARRQYGRLLLDIVDFADPLPGPAVEQATAMSTAHDLEQRLREILEVTPKTRQAWPGVALAVALAFLILPCELHYDVVGRSAPAAITAERDSTAEGNRLPAGNREAKPLSPFCCPS